MKDWFISVKESNHEFNLNHILTRNPIQIYLLLFGAEFLALFSPRAHSHAPNYRVLKLYA